MEAPHVALQRKTKRSRWRFSIICIIAIMVLIAIIVPVVSVFARRGRSNSLSSTVLLPLYIYPKPAAWDQLYEM